MRLKFYFLFTLCFSFSILFSQQEIVIPLRYETAGYSPDVEAGLKGSDNEILTPTVNSEMNVNEAGALIYSLPIETLKGLNNFQPNVAVIYNSQSGNGQAGWGWNIVGISMISRGGKSKEIDGITLGPQFNEYDPYYLDGQRLIKINNDTFTTEKFSKIKISKPSTGEFSFVVQYTDGKIAKYKELLTGQNYIATLIDSFNNEIHYTYEVENNTPRITKITYGGSGPSNDKFYINFTYKNRQKNVQIYRNGIIYTNSRVLSEIESGSTYSLLYRKYEFVHDHIEDNSVERLRTILVKNENGESLKPLNFGYNTSKEGLIKINSNVIDFLPANGLPYGTTGLGSATIGDFYGTNDMTPVFQVKNGAGYSLLSDKVENDSGTMLFSGKVLNLENKITANDQIIIVNEKNIGSENVDIPTAPENNQLKDEIVFEIWDHITHTSRKVNVSVQGGLIDIQTYIAPDPYDDPYGYGTFETQYIRDKTRRDYIQGDFNNDGLTDFLIVESQNLNRSNRVYFVELGKQNSGKEIQVSPVVMDELLNLKGREIYPIEFDGDGIPELMVVTKYTAKYDIYKINFTNTSLQSVLLNQDLFNFSSDTPLFFGDFNGDGLTDFLTPQKVYEIPENADSGLEMGEVYYKMETENLIWWKYTGNGVSFIKNEENYTEQKIAYLKPSQSNYIKKSTFWQKFWNGKPDEYEYTRYSTHNIIIADFNNDGRSDIITLDKIGSAKYNVNGYLNNVPINNLSNLLARISNSFPFIVYYQSSITNRVNLYENKNLQGGTFKQASSTSIEGVRISPLSMVLPKVDFDKLQESNVGIYIYDALYKGSTYITIDNSAFLEKQIQEVNNGSEVLQKVEYRNMIDRLYMGSLVGGKTDEATYLYKPRGEFKYPFYVHKANSSLYLVSKIHTLFSNKILTKEYRYENGIQNFDGKGFLGFQKTYLSDAYESEFVNGSYKNRDPIKALFWNIQTKDPLMENVVIKSTYGGITKFFTGTTITNKKFDRGNHQYLILSTDEILKDNLKKVTISKKYDYDENDELKLKNSYTDFGGIGTSISKYNYKTEFSNSDHYFYGKIANVENSVYRDGLSFTTKDEFNYYPNGEVRENLKYGNNANAPPIITSYTYDAIGNVKTQTLSATGVASQITTYDYDATDRYVSKTTTPDGLSTIATVNALGRVSSETSALGLVTNYTYDSWGNISEVTDFLGKKTTISKSVAEDSNDGIYNLHKRREGGTETIVTFDQFDREIQTKNQSINGKWLVSRTVYDIFGKKEKVSESFFEGATPKWNTVEYDELNRPIKNIAFTGKTITTCYEGLKVTVDDGYKKTSKTLDAMGYTIRQQDHGGVIAYFYFPNGALRETNYEGIKTIFEIDDWGNKKKITDPSAGIFTYEYDSLNRLTRDENPKGYTSYSYDILGRPLTEDTYGKTTAENTSIQKTYTYDPVTKLPLTITGASNGQTFIYTTLYDQYFRIKGKIEQTPDFTYSSNTTFDSYGRADVVSISTVLNSPSLTSSSSIKNVYDTNGILIQQNDTITGGMVWHVSDVNAQGQTQQMEYGNGFTISNQYRTSDFSLTNTKHKSSLSAITVLDVNYDYNVDKGVLNSRYNKTFGKDEKYTYDALNRLLSETVNNVLVNEYTYDKRGRLTSNTELGKYNYNESDYKLQNIAFNTSGQNVNTQRGFADVKYNAFKSPLQITLAGKDDLVFSYSTLKSRYKMTSSVTGITKLYSSDFAVEIVKNGGKTEIITYITGDPYSANYIKKTSLFKNIRSEANYFLHRDNLGSILAITNTDGEEVEKRYFDAWGNLKAMTDAENQLITQDPKMLFMDRGYTGHEHLQSIGLINMNARLYDPILRRFLSPDNFVQDPFNTQSFDRFSYVFNNPLLYTDPSGNFGIVAAVIIAVAVAVVSNGIANMIAGIPFWYGMGKSAVIGAVSGYISFGIGLEALTSFGSGVSFGKAIFEAGMHSITSGMMSSLDGSNGGSAMLSGLVSSLLASGVNALGVNFAKSKTEGNTVYNGFGQNYMKAAMIAVGGISGGISATIAGGKFMDGFRQGLITSGLNHVVHLGVAAIQERDQIRSVFDDPDGIPESNMDSVNEARAKVQGLFTAGMNKHASKATEIIDLETNTEMAGMTDVDKVIITGSGKNLMAKTTAKIYVTYYKKAFSSWYSLGVTILHEYYHVMDYGSGYVSSISTSMYRKFGNTLEASNQISIQKEERGFNFVFGLGATWSNFNNYRHLYGY